MSLPLPIVVYNSAVAVTIVSVGVLLARLCRFVRRVRRIGQKVDLIPGPRRDFITGNLLQIAPLDCDKRLAWFISNCVKFKTAYSLWFGPFMPKVFVCHPSTVKVLLSSYEGKALHRSSGYKFLADVIGNGLIVSSGEAWLRNRRLITHAFHFDILKRYAIITNEATDILLEKLETVCDMESPQGGSIDVVPHVSLCTFNVMLRCAFSNDDDVQRQSLKNPFVTATTRQTKLIHNRLNNPLLHMDAIYRMTAERRELVECNRICKQFVCSIIDKKKMDLNTVQSDGYPMKGARDFLDILLLARDEEGMGFTELELQHEVNTFLAAGFETTATAITWCLYNLSRHPEYQSKAREDVDALLKDRESDYIVWGDLNRLTYLTMCIKESLRMFPSIPSVSRGIENPMEIDGVVLEPGTEVVANIFDLHHNPYVWGEDHMDYKPDRFSLENVTHMDPHAFVPFAAGPRNCIGQHFAMNQLKIIVARMLSRFFLENDPDHAVECSTQIVLRAKKGIHLFLKKR